MLKNKHCFYKLKIKQNIFSYPKLFLKTESYILKVMPGMLSILYKAIIMIFHNH